MRRCLALKIREAVIVAAVRTPIGKRGGALSGWHPADLLGFTLRSLLDRAGVDPSLVDDVIGGCATQTGEQACNVTRNAWVAAGLPQGVAATTVDRQCGSSQQAAHFAAQGVMAGVYDLVIACGVEVMSAVAVDASAADGAGPYSLAFVEACDGQLMTPTECAQHIADSGGFSRADMDAFALESHRRAAKAADTGAFAREILPVPERRAEEEGIPAAYGPFVSADEGIRRDTSLDGLGALEPAGPDNPIAVPGITAGNSSPASDGAGAVLIASRRAAHRLGLVPRAVFKHFAVGGDSASRSFTAANPVTRKLFDRTGLTAADMDAAEVSEAFAPVTMSWIHEFDADPAAVNPRGGAIALGHPAGASGVRLLVTLLHTLEDTGGRLGLQAMCEGGGLANVTVIERV